MNADDVITDGWPKVLAMIVCLTIAATDVTSVPVFANEWWPLCYGLAAAGLLSWRVTWRRPLLVYAFGAPLFAASVSRAFVRTFAEDPRYSSAALNLLIAIYTFGFVRNRQTQENP